MLFTSPTNNNENALLCLAISEKETFVVDYAVDDASITAG